jgi:hypothetical protein
VKNILQHAAKSAQNRGALIKICLIIPKIKFERQDLGFYCDSRMKMSVAFSLSERQEEASATDDEGSE